MKKAFSKYLNSIFNEILVLKVGETISIQTDQSLWFILLKEHYLKINKKKLLLFENETQFNHQLVSERYQIPN